MSLINLEVLHKSFGRGIVVSENGKYFTVRFDTVEKTFVYPDIFERFLTLADGSISEQIVADLATAKAKKEREIEKKNEENRRAMTRGIVIPGKENLNSDGDDEDGRKNSEEEG